MLPSPLHPEGPRTNRQGDEPRGRAFILDVGCGTGKGLRALRPWVKRGLMAGLDLPPKMIEVAPRKLSGHPGIDLRRRRRQNPPLA